MRNYEIGKRGMRQDVSVHAGNLRITHHEVHEGLDRISIVNFVLFVSLRGEFFSPRIALSGDDSRAVEFDRIVPEDLSFGFT